MKRYICPECHYTYFEEEGDPDSQIPAGTAFEELPEGWCCPVCKHPKEGFNEYKG